MEIRTEDPGSQARVWEVVLALVARDFKSQYRRSMLGPVWAILQPVAYTAMFVFLRGVLSAGDQGVDYVLTAFGALVPWMFFSNAIVRSAPSVRRNAAIVKKTSLRREVFLVAAIALSVLDLAISSVLLAVLVAVIGSGVGLNALWAVPLAIAISVLALGIGLMAAAVATYKWDIVYAIPFLMQFWLLASPVMYTRSEVPTSQLWLFDLNPMAGLLEGFRNAVVLNVAPDLAALSLSFLLVSIVLAVAWPLFRSASQYFADVL